MNAGGDLVVVATADPPLRDAVLSVAAAAGLAPEVVSEAGRLRSAWSPAALVVVGADLAEDVAALALPRRASVYVVASGEASAELCGWSAQLGAAVAILPAAAGWLSAAMSDTAGQPAVNGTLIAVQGAAGGVGASTVATGLAVVGARLGRRVLLVDIDPDSGGLDLLLGAERVPGWRWPRLAEARGQLGDLSGHLPCVDGVDLLSTDRDHDAPARPDQVATVLRSGMRSHDLVVADLRRGDSPMGSEALRLAHTHLLVVPNDIRGVAAGQIQLRRLGQPLRTAQSLAQPRLLVRRGRGPGLRCDTVATSLGLPLVGVVADDLGLASAAVRGEPPARTSRSGLARLCRSLLEGETVASPGAAA